MTRRRWLLASKLLCCCRNTTTGLLRLWSAVALVLLILRYPQELVDPEEHKLPTGSLSDYRISSKETAMAEQLIESMSGEWKPDDYHDEFRERLQAVLTKRIKQKGGTTTVEDEPAPREDASTNVVDFMSLLQKSLDAKKRTPARKTAVTAAPKKAATKKAKAPAKAPAKAAKVETVNKLLSTGKRMNDSWQNHQKK